VLALVFLRMLSRVMWPEPPNSQVMHVWGYLDFTCWAPLAFHPHQLTRRGLGMR
jgi:hypothetical protein